MRQSYLSWLRAKKSTYAGFTIVELLIVIVVIAILTTITVVAFNGISSQAKQTALKSDLVSAAKQIQLIKVKDGIYPPNLSDVQHADSTTFDYIPNNALDTFCLSASSAVLPAVTYYLIEGGTITEGPCPLPDGTFMQSISSSNCPSGRIRAVDARDNHTYWVQKLNDGHCWMLTNLAYGGGGSNTYGDVKSLQEGTNDTAGVFNVAKYYIVPDTINFTVEPAAPSTSNNGTSQYGYLYNWCGSMGVQTTAACASTLTPAPIVSTSVCPSGWKLPTGGANGEYKTLNDAVNNGSVANDTLLLTAWLIQRGGIWYDGTFGGQGSITMYASSTQLSSTSAYNFYSRSSTVNVANSNYNVNKKIAIAVRCVAAH